MKIAVAGLGLIGGSFYKAALRAGHDVVGLHHGDAHGVEDADLVLVCLPPEAIVPWVLAHAPQFKDGALVVDICGVKRGIVAAVGGNDGGEVTSEPLPVTRSSAAPQNTGHGARITGHSTGPGPAPACRWHFVGGHPMAGREVSGYENSSADLFDGASMILTPEDGTPETDLHTLEAFFASVGFRETVRTTPERHDELIAFTSQLSHVVATAFARDPLTAAATGFTGGSFADMTRIATQDASTWSELYAENRDKLLAVLDRFRDRLAEFRDALAAGDDEAVRRMIREGSEAKANMATPRQKPRNGTREAARQEPRGTTIGRGALRLSIRGASHAPYLRFSLEGIPAGLAIDRKALAALMVRRAPGRDALSTGRRESDEIEWRGGLDAEGRTTGEPLVGTIANRDARPADYGKGRTVPRPGHADFPQWVEAGSIPTGGGANSGRLTAALCAAGGVCLQWLERRGIAVHARVEAIHGNSANPAAEVAAAKAAGDSVGGTIVCEATGMPAGIGGALFDGIETALSGALFAIPGVKGVEFGNGFAAAALRGSENNDAFVVGDGGTVRTATNRHGGLLGGRTTGMPVTFRVALKPTPTIFRPQPSVDLATMRPAVCESKGRHDPCIVLRAVPVVEAVAALALADALIAAEAASPRVCLTLTAKTLDEDLAQYRSQRYFADLVELRVDLLEPDERARAAEFPALVPVPVVLTFRRKRDGGAFEGPEEERATFFRSVLRPGGFAYVDFEDDFRDPELAEAAHAAGARIIRSLHDFTGPVTDTPARCRAMRGATDEIPKIAFLPTSPDDVARLFAETADFTDIPHILCAMGPMGLASRALAARTHSCLTYASVGGLGDIGHVSPQELVRTYRLRTVRPDAALYGVTGWPITTTRSPELHNAAFAAADADALMVPIPSRTAEAAFRFLKATGMRGMAVTIPHKRAIMPLLDRIDPSAQAVGAVNTIVLEGGQYVGYNTDVAGFAEAFATFAGEDLAGRRAALLGDGGAAQGVKEALRQLGVAYEVFHRRTPPQGFDFLVNATPVDPIPDYVFTGREAVYDLRYAPEETPLMRRARAAGCRAENGLSMLAAQAREQRKLWRAI